MEQNQEKKFVCKFCNKRYPCGKSLGGHIRTHMNNENSAETEERAAELPMNRLISISNGKSIKRVAEAEAGGVGVGQSAAYGLRENPKKTKRFSDSGNASLLKEMMICKECGKGFRSLKALCGHMSCHSEKERVFHKFEDHSRNSEKQKLIMDSQSDTETSAPNGRRSKRIRYKTIGVYSNNSENLANVSSSISEIEQEQEEVAICLMMLSRDSGCKKGLNSVADSSDNNSVVLEDKSSSIDVRITIKNNMKCVSNSIEFLKMKQKRDSKLKSAEPGPPSENSDSGYFRNGPKKVESDVSVDGFPKNIEFKKLNVESGSGFEGFDAIFGKSSSKFKGVKTGFPKDLFSEVGDNRADRALTKYDLRRSAKKTDNYSPEYLCNSSQKGSKYECLTCSRTFDSHRALGGHRASHTKVNDCNESMHESGEDSLANDSFHVPMSSDTKVTKSSHAKSLATLPRGSSGNAEKRLGSKKNKGHECPFCFRVFKSGQALGGHKRSHFVGGSEGRTLVIKQDSPDVPTLIDLNLPAPVEEDAMGNAGFMHW